MAALPEDDAPTMSGAPDDRVVGTSTEGGDDDDGDTTAAVGEPPASNEPDDEPAGHEAEDQTMQQLAARPSDPGAAASTAEDVRPKLPSTASLVSAPVTQPSPPRPGSSHETLPVTTDREPEIVEVDSDHLEPIEEADDVTATGPRVDTSKLPLTIPGTVEIRNVEAAPIDEDENEVKTEVRTLGMPIPETLRAASELASRPAPRLESLRGQPASSPRPAAGVPAVAAYDVDTAAADDEPDSVTTEAPAPRVASVPELDPPIVAPNTERRSSASFKATARASRPAHDDPPTRPGLVEDPPTRPGLGEPPELATSPGVGEPATSPGVGDPPTTPGLGDTTASAGSSASAASVKHVLAATMKTGDIPIIAPDIDEEDESTTRGPAVDPFGEDDSVTTQAPAVPVDLVAAAVGTLPVDFDDGTDGTTQRLKKGRDRADSEYDSITTQAPGNLTNILRVIAADDDTGVLPATGERLPVDDEEPLENRTAVMANAPLKRIIDEVSAQQQQPQAGAFPPIRPTGPGINLAQHGARGAAAPQLHPTSESGLRARQGSASGEHASLGAIGVHDPRPSGVGPSGRHLETGPQDPRALAATIEAFNRGQPSVHDVELGKGPRYGLIVGIVAVVCAVIPVSVFVILNRADANGPLHVASTPSSDFQAHGEAPRAKYEKPKPKPPETSASASASAAPPSKPPRRGFPFRR